MSANELVVCGFDGTLYRSPVSPIGDPDWYFHAHSLAGWEAPGFDKRWVLPTLQQVRRAAADPLACVILITSRPDHKAMRKVLKAMLDKTEVPWQGVYLKPVLAGETIALYKARVIAERLRQDENLKRVTMYDSSPDNLLAVQVITLSLGRQFTPVLSKG